MTGPVLPAPSLARTTPARHPSPGHPGAARVVLARYARNRRPADALDQWAFCSITTSPGTRAYYDQLRARGKTHRQALRELANRWVGILHICLERGQLYDEAAAWQHLQAAA
jgi:hypothetical protein